VCKISQPSVTYLIYTSQHSDVTHKKQFSRHSEGLFQQDGARERTSKATVVWLDANTKHYIPPEDWPRPPNSPDLSPIENGWSIMATAVYANSEPQSLQALKHRLWKAWKSISPSTLQNIIGSMPNRLKAVTKNKGDTIPYTNSGQRHRLTLTFFIYVVVLFVLF